MATPHFYLRDKESSEPSLISLYYYHNNKRFVFSTGYSVKPSLWSFTKERVKTASPLSETINPVLDNLAISVQELYERVLQEKGQVTNADLKNGLDIVRGKIKEDLTLFEYIEQFIEKRKDSPQYTAGTIQVYNTAFKHLQAYAKKKRREFDFPDMDYKFFAGYTDYLLKQEYTNNHVNKILSTLKTFLNEATRDETNKFLKFKDVKLKVQKESAEEIYLTEHELTTLFYFDFSKYPGVERVRDAFIVGAYTGLRYSDFTRIKAENITVIDGKKILDITTKKTGKRVYIPLHPYVRAILDKYNGNLPAIAISNQKMNEHLKTMGKLAGFTETVFKSKTKGGRKGTKEYRKYELIKTHTARRSFATNAYKAFIPVPSIMEITGHTTEKSFMRYLRITGRENAVILSENRFFVGSHLKVAK